MHKKSVFDDLGPMPPAAALVGWNLVDYDEQARWTKVGFLGKLEFGNPSGFIQGGILTAMLDEVMGSAVIIATSASFYTTTISLSVDFIQPAKIGPIMGLGKVTSLKKSIAFVEGQLMSDDDEIICRSVSTCKLTKMPER